MSIAFTPRPAAFMDTNVIATVSPEFTPVWMSNVPAALNRLVPLKSVRPAMSSKDSGLTAFPIGDSR
jgi:hypothetical protein